ncbi:UDP-glycosyltransferase 83A1 [Iris pallida]|uniref:UDP-glycosyltransferase 83A1 n=1 Tax=Iris pallida TaxID=29817 RepID=A0AAX6DUL0_IRIPA|nr:UDP-glycosyltransferase 83A1 [Iris pallida]
MGSRTPHVLVLPYPAQGHVIPLMELSHCLLDRGFKITFVNTEFNHDRVVNALSERGIEIDQRMQLVSIPDGMAPDEDRDNFASLGENMLLVMPDHLEQLVGRINGSGGEKITWMVADLCMAFAFRVAKKMGIKSVAFWPAASATLAVLISIPKLIEEGVLDDDGVPRTEGMMINVIPDMPPIDPRGLPWNLTSNPELRKSIYQYLMNNVRETKLAEFTISNSFQELESGAFAYMPNISPLGPLFADEDSDRQTGQFWPEDASCMSWLNEQPANSVIYVAFGSTGILNRNQFRELALGLELSARPFLWVVRPDLTNTSSDAYPAGFRDCVASRGRVVGWSPQQKVLAHPSVACFVTHCGWNSTMEGVRNGVPFLCWPYFGYQFVNQSYICDVWKVGLKMSPGDGGIVSSEQIKVKVEELLGDEDLSARSLKLKEKANDNVREGGSSYRNMNIFINAMKE